MFVLTLPLSDSDATLETVGGKGMSLAKLARAGLPVPGGFHITTAAYRQFVAENGLQPRILEALQGVDTGSPDSLDHASDEITGLFAAAPIPSAITAAIKTAYARLAAAETSGSQGIPSAREATVAVRSSATAEDLPGASFAGQQETYLNIHGASAVLDAVKKCWASLWTARAIAYRARQGIDPASVALAVVVQELVCADAAGVLFTANPVTGGRDELMITAAWGLGEAIVGGSVTPDTLIVEKATGKVTRRETSEKRLMTVRTETGTREQPVPELLQKSPVLSDAQAARLANLGVEIEQLYAMPMDIEWALANDQFAILQARPVTALPEPPLAWAHSHPKALMMRGSFAEFVPNPVSPLFATLAIPIAQDLTQKLMKDFLEVKNFDNYYFEVINNYVYVGMVLNADLFWKMSVGSLFKMKKLLRTGRERWAVVSRKIDDVAGRYQGDLGALTAPQLLAGVREIFTATAEYYTVAQSGPIPAAPYSELIFGRFYNSLVKRKEDPATPAFLLGFETLPLRAEKSLYDLAQWIKEQPDLAQVIQSTPTQEICAALQSNPLPLPLWGEFLSRFSAHLAAFGHTLYDLDFAKPVPADDPAPVIETVKAYLAGQGANPYQRQQAQVERREQAEQAILKRLDPLRRRWFVKLLHYAQDCAPDREDCIAGMGAGYPRMHRMLLELGRRLAAGGAIAQPADIYWLEAQEADALAAALEADMAITPHIAQIDQRKSRWQRMRQVNPPVSIPEKSFMSRFLAHDNPEGNRIKGYGASAGKVTAPACILRGPEEFGGMRPGDVIVAVNTTPAWTPLFAMASAVVTDIGGPLSHSSIVAREYGIPAVMATGSATRRIQHRQMITVDGTNGVVILEPDQDSGAISGSGEPPAEWKLPKGAYAAMRNNIVELMPGPLSPLFATLGRSAINAAYHNHMSNFGLGDILPTEAIITVNGYAYYNGSLSARSLGRILWDAGKIMRKMFTGAVERWTEAGRPRYFELVSAWQSQPWRSLTNLELVDGAKKLTTAAIDAYATLVSGVIPAAWMTEALFTRVYNALVRRRGDPPAPTFLLGFDSLPIRAEKSLYNLAQWARPEPALAQRLENTPTSQLVSWYQADVVPGDVSPQAWQEWRARFREHLEQFGYAIYDLDFAMPTPADDPSPLIDTLKLYLRGQGADPVLRQRETSERREQAQREIEQRLKGLRLKLFKKTLAPAQKYAPLREEALVEIGLAYPSIRQVLRELGERLARHGATTAADDIFWLTEDEVRQAAGSLDAGLAPEDFTGAVRQRKAENAAARRASPPVALPQMKLFGFDLMSIKGKRGRGGKGNVIKGVAASPGKVTAAARVLRGPEEFSQMRPGDVLVAAITTPAWTPLFAMASAIVTDVGGPLSHGSIVAREYGIPAVLGTGSATRRIHSGDVVTVDGRAGTVKVQVG